MTNGTVGNIVLVELLAGRMKSLDHFRVVFLVTAFVCLLCTGSAFAMEVGETVDLLVPDISYFPEEHQIHQFTCRAVTEHAFFMVQDTTFFDLPDTLQDFQIIWDNLMTPAELDSISAQFEGAGVDVFGTVTSLLGPVPETENNDERIWIIFTDMPNYFPVPGIPVFLRLQNWVYTWPDDFDGDISTGNNHDCFYVNLGCYKNLPGASWELIRGSIHTWSVATGIGELLRIAHNRHEDLWIVRGIGLFTQFLNYGLTTEYSGKVGIEAYLTDFARGGGIELSSWCSGQMGKAFGVNQGGELLWFKYIEQRFGSHTISEIIASPKTGMLNIANALSPSIPDSEAVESIIYPLYEDWLITNIVAHIAGGYAGGIYRYNFLDGTGYVFTMIDSPASFMGEFSTYPFPTWIAPHIHGVSAQVFAAQYALFEGDYAASGDTTVYFNGMYNQNNGSGPNINGSWTVYRIVLSDDSTLQYVDSLELDDQYNGTFDLDGSSTYLVLTNNNPGGTARIRYSFSQDFAPRSLFLAVLQNGMNQHYMQVYSTLFREDTQLPYGFDWVGPELEILHLNENGTADSTAIIPLDFLSGTLWTGKVHAWSAGNYKLACNGYDSTGVLYEDSLMLAVGFGGSGKLILDIQKARFEILAGTVPDEAMVTLSETNAMGVSVCTNLSINSASGALTGITAGPVTVSCDVGLISFPAETSQGAIFHLDGDQWDELDSYFLSDRMYASVTKSGIYVLGQSPGLFSPSVSTVPVLYENFPNPFSSLVSFRFSLPEMCSVTLDMYDMSGRLVTTLNNSELSGGVHTLSWDGSDDSGSQVPSGVYFARFEASEFVETVKVVRIVTGAF